MTEALPDTRKPPACHVIQKLQVIRPWLEKESGFETACLTADRESAQVLSLEQEILWSETLNRKGIWGFDEFLA